MKRWRNDEEREEGDKEKRDSATPTPFFTHASDPRKAPLSLYAVRARRTPDPPKRSPSLALPLADSGSFSKCPLLLSLRDAPPSRQNCPNSKVPYSLLRRSLSAPAEPAMAPIETRFVLILWV